MPVYSVGDTYVFDDPRETWTITEVTDDTISWESDLGATRQTTLDPLLPSLRSAAPEIGAVTRIISEKNGDLWPLVVGNETHFVVAAGMDQPPYSQSLAWTCRVVGTNLVTVPAGRFDTYKIACARSDGFRLNTYHAPAVGYFVRREGSTAENEGQARSLVAYQNGMGDHLVAAHSPSAAAMNPLGSPPVAAPAPVADVKSLAPIGGPGEPGAGAGAAAAASPPSSSGAIEAPRPLVAVGPASDMSAPASAAADAPTWEVHHESDHAAAATSAPPPQAITPPQASTPAAAPPGPVTTPAPMGARQAASVSTGGRAWRGAGVRLGSFGSATTAEAGWRKFQASYPTLLKGLSPRIESVLIEGRGRFHRLYVGPFPSKADAKGLCGKIAEMGQTCDVQTFD